MYFLILHLICTFSRSRKIGAISAVWSHIFHRKNHKCNIFWTSDHKYEFFSASGCISNVRPSRKLQTLYMTPANLFLSNLKQKFMESFLEAYRFLIKLFFWWTIISRFYVSSYKEWKHHRVDFFLIFACVYFSGGFFPAVLFLFFSRVCFSMDFFSGDNSPGGGGEEST